MNRRYSMLGTRVGFAWLLAATAACSTKPAVPDTFEWGTARIVTDAGPNDIVPTGASGTGERALKFAAGGAGAGALSSGLACLAAGPLFALCIAAVVPTATAMTAAGMAVAGAATADSAEMVQARRDMLRAALAGADVHADLAVALRSALSGGTTGGEAAAAPVSNSTAYPWTVELSALHLDAAEHEGDKPFAVAMSARLKLLRPGDGVVGFDKHYAAVSPAKLTLSAWQADGGAMLTTAWKDALALLASQMARDLRP